MIKDRKTGNLGPIIPEGKEKLKKGRKAIDNNRMRFCSGTAKFYPKK